MGVSCNAQADLLTKTMAKYCFVVRAYSTHPDEGWERILGQFPTHQMAQQAIAFFGILMQNDYNGFRIIKTIKFKD